MNKKIVQKVRSPLDNQFGPRVRFNWGYHDAAFDSSRGKARIIVDGHDLGHVSRSFDPDYAKGYEYGLRDYQAGDYHGDSQNAWQENRKLCDYGEVT